MWSSISTEFRRLVHMSAISPVLGEHGICGTHPDGRFHGQSTDRGEARGGTIHGPGATVPPGGGAPRGVGAGVPPTRHGVGAGDPHGVTGGARHGDLRDLIMPITVPAEIALSDPVPVGLTPLVPAAIMPAIVPVAADIP